MPDDLATIPKLRTPEYPEPETRRYLTDTEKRFVRERQNGKCAGCGIEPKAWEYDHKTPRWTGQVNQKDLGEWQAFGSRKDCKCHRIKTGEEAKHRAKMNRLRGKAGQLKRRKERGPLLKSPRKLTSRSCLGTKPKNYISPLSKEYRRKVRERMER